jgi:hypothetical protein
VTTSPGVKPEDFIAIATPNDPFSRTTDVPSTGPGDIPLPAVQLIGLVIASAWALLTRGGIKVAAIAVIFKAQAIGNWVMGVSLNTLRLLETIKQL